MLLWGHPGQRIGGLAGACAGVSKSKSSFKIAFLSILALYSPCTVKISFPIHLIPWALTCSSITGSNSSITYNVSTFDANSSISFIGSGFTNPNLRTDALGNTSFTYWYTIPLVITPIFVSLYSTLLMSNVHASSAILFKRSSTKIWRLIAFPGIITFFATFLSYGLSSISCLSSRLTIPCECESLVVERRITGVSYFSESSYALFVNTLASSLSDGSTTGTIAALATILESCSFCELYIPGSSAATKTIPPLTPI